MLDKTELQKLIEAPIGETCLITDPFPLIDAAKFRVMKKVNSKMSDKSDFAGCLQFLKDDKGEKRPTVVIYVPTPDFDLTNAVLQDELGATICHEFGHIYQHIAGKLKKSRGIHPHAYALVEENERDADLHALFCGYGKILADKFERLWEKHKDEGMFRFVNADFPMRVILLRKLLEKYAVSPEEGSRRIRKYHIDCKKRILYYTVAYSNGEFTRFKQKIKSITFEERSKILVNLSGLIENKYDHVVMTRKDCVFD